MHTTLRVLALVIFVAACTPGPKPVAGKGDPAAHEAFQNYVTAINSNNVGSLLDMMTDDIVFQSPHEPELVGKAAVRPWLQAYLGAYTIHWDKTSNEFVVSGDWAFERYSYKSSDTPKHDGPVVEDTGKGLVIYHHDTDGKWRVARDAWSSDLPIAAK